jgi:hypothetical protein
MRHGRLQAHAGPSCLPGQSLSDYRSLEQPARKTDFRSLQKKVRIAGFSFPHEGVGGAAPRFRFFVVQQVKHTMLLMIEKNHVGFKRSSKVQISY